MAVGFLSHRSRFDSNRPCRLPPAQEGMRIGPAPPLLDSGLRRNDETGRFNALVGGGVCGSFSPRIPLPWIPAFAGMTNWAAGMRPMVGMTPGHWLGTGFNAAGFTLTPTLSH